MQSHASTRWSRILRSILRIDPSPPCLNSQKCFLGRLVQQSLVKEMPTSGRKLVHLQCNFIPPLITRSKRKWNANDIVTSTETMGKRRSSVSAKNAVNHDGNVSSSHRRKDHLQPEQQSPNSRASTTGLDDDPLGYAIRLCREETNPSPHLFTSAIAACAKFKPSARVDDALQILDLMMEHSIKRNVVTYNSAITACANARAGARIDDAFEVLELMESARISPDVVTFSSLLRACAKARPARVQDARDLMCRMRTEGLKPNVYTYAAMISALANAKPCTNAAEAMELLIDMTEMKFVSSCFETILFNVSSTCCVTVSQYLLRAGASVCACGGGRWRVVPLFVTASHLQYLM
eukprot:m.1395878 g.1395878  ORF g.1395878 m.1395878 type:complete len:351 (+) comp24994_c1_seq40:262-1314(+)